MRNLGGKASAAVLGLLACVSTLLLTAPRPVRAADDREIPKHWSHSPYFHWVQKVDPAAGSVTYTINGSRPSGGNFTLNSHRCVVHAGFHLNRGENHIAISQAGKKLFEAVLYYAPSIEQYFVPKEFRPTVFHTLEQEAPCLECHRMAAEKKDYRANFSGNVCTPCHRNKVEGKEFPHAASLTWACLQCHPAEPQEHGELPGAKVRYYIENVENVGRLCYRCHEQFKQELDGYAYVHGPVAEGNCFLCHDLHGATRRNLLLEEPVKLCVDCHEMQAVLEKPDIHPVIRSTGCTACHNAHGSNYPLQLFANLYPLCYTCHPRIKSQQRSGHPVEGHPVKGPKDPTDKSRKFTCLSCHNPHASDGYALLPETEQMKVCTRCHKI